ncbi:MAG: BON domain-containing protein, partial [Mycolicibacterium sp.]|nr:BON domain-containing protein [Mycolicibacterium sp.]
MSSDAQLNEDVVGQLKYDPAIDSSRIAVAVFDGIVTLKGSVPSYWQRQEAELAVGPVRGVR